MRRREGETREMKRDQKGRRVGRKEETDTLVIAGKEKPCFMLNYSTQHTPGYHIIY